MIERPLSQAIYDRLAAHIANNGALVAFPQYRNEKLREALECAFRELKSIMEDAA